MNASDIATPSNLRQPSSSRVHLLAVCALLAPWLAAWVAAAVRAAAVVSRLRGPARLARAAACSRRAVERAVPRDRCARALLRIEQLAHEEPCRIFRSESGMAVRAAVRRGWTDGVRLRLVSRSTERCDLLWDRLPMAFGFAGLVAGTLMDRAPQRILQWLLAFAAVGAGTVLYWHVSGNLMPYLVMQVGFIAAALIATAFTTSRYTHANRVYAAAGSVCGRHDFRAARPSGVCIARRMDQRAHAEASVACAAIVIVYSMLRERRAKPALPL